MAEDPTEPAAPAQTTPDQPINGCGEVNQPPAAAPTSPPAQVDAPTVERPVVRPRSAPSRNFQSPAAPSRIGQLLSGRHRGGEPDATEEPVVEPLVVRPRAEGPVPVPMAVAPAAAVVTASAQPNRPTDTVEISVTGPTADSVPVGPQQVPTAQVETGADALQKTKPVHQAQPLEPAESTDFANRIRLIARKYGWLAAAGGLAVVVMLCSAPLISQAGLTWNPAAPAPVSTAVPTQAPSAPAAAPTTAIPLAAATATSAPTPHRSTGTVEKRSTEKSGAPAVPSGPVLLGPADNAGLVRMLRDYCTAHYGIADAQLRQGTGQAENNWECRVRGKNPLIDMNVACRDKYGSTAFASYTNRNDALSWRCYQR